MKQKFVIQLARLNIPGDDERSFTKSTVIEFFYNAI